MKHIYLSGYQLFQHKTYYVQVHKVINQLPTMHYTEICSCGKLSNKNEIY